MHGPTCIFWANLTPFSLKAEDEDEDEEEEKGYIARLGRKIVDNLQVTSNPYLLLCITMRGTGYNPNLQVTVRDVHVRLEHLEHAPGGRPVALGRLRRGPSVILPLQSSLYGESL